MDSKYEAGDEIVEWREKGVKHYYLGEGQYQAVVSYTEPAAPGNKTQSYLTEAATRASTTGQVQTEQMPYDTYISATNKSNNYGAEEKLWVGTNNTAFIFVFLPTLPDNADVTAAQLYFSYYYNITTGYLTVGAYPVEFEWDELTLTWNLANAQENMGLGASCLGTTRLNGTRTITTTSVSVTDAVKSWYASKETNNYGIALKRVGGTNNSVILVPFDAYDDHAPYFVIDYILRDLPISSGLYYIRNGRLSTQFMQPDDGVMDDDDGDIEDMFYELWKLDCEEYQKWNTRITLSINGTSNPAISTLNFYNYSTNTVINDLSETELVIFVACQSAYSEEGVVSICQAAVDAGATCAIGFTDTINYIKSGEWLEKMFHYYRMGYTISYSCSKASTDLGGAGNVDSYVCFWEKTNN